jgi:RNA polymerase sigma-70 factor (ECF subfamily)
LLEDQDRARWDRAQITEGVVLAERALAEDTDWLQIAAFYAVLEGVHPTPVVRLNRAVAVGMAEGLSAGLALLDGLDDALGEYHLLPAARADLMRRLSRWTDAEVEGRG